MRNSKYIIQALLCLSACYIDSSLAQQAPEQRDTSLANNSDAFSLFEAVESASARDSSASRPVRESRATIGEPEFTLIGTARIGNSYKVMIQHRSGETVVVDANAADRTAITNYTNYSIVNVTGREVSISYPGNTPCVEFLDRGVRCSGASNIAVLSLSTSDPIAPRAPDESANEEAEIAAGDAPPVNPFEALRDSQNGRAANGQDGNTNGARFTPRRINPEDVPEGMRIIATPFGDRLVEE